MKRSGTAPVRLAALVTALLALACNLPAAIASKPTPPLALPVIPPQSAPTIVPSVPPTVTVAPPTATVGVSHVAVPSESRPSGTLIYDVVSEDTAPEKRAPYGDSYDINRLERPFLQDMTYVPDLDISTFKVSKDDTWWYVSIEMVGADPNNELGIDFGVELDLDIDGFGDYLIWAHPPYADKWDTSPVQIFQDKNHDTGGRSAEKSDAPITTDGYETQIFHGGVGDPDPDVAWMRTSAGDAGTVQFAFKRSWSGSLFMLGVVADAGLKDPRKLDYVDRFTAADAGSPVRDNKNYPLKALFAVDNVCRAAFGFDATGYEPQLCPTTEPRATRKPRTPSPPSEEAPGIFPPVFCLPAGTLIDTPNGPVSVQSLRLGDPVWTTNSAGQRAPGTILQLARLPAPMHHPLVQVALRDGRELAASPGHPTIDGRTFADLRLGDRLDGARIVKLQVVSSDQPATYDLLPSGETGFYWANGVLIGSTLHE